MNILYIGLGSNLGDRKKHLDKAVSVIGKTIGKVNAVSDYYESEAWGYESKNEFLNIVLILETDLFPMDVLRKVQKIERELGSMGHRTQDGGYADRIIDIDLLACDGEIVRNPVLTLPHPHMHERLFVMIPFVSVAPEWIHPVFHKTATDLLSDLQWVDSGPLKK